jgi:hypothetical protein
MAQLREMEQLALAAAATSIADINLDTLPEETAHVSNCGSANRNNPDYEAILVKYR